MLFKLIIMVDTIITVVDIVIMVAKMAAKNFEELRYQYNYSFAKLLEHHRH